MIAWKWVRQVWIGAAPNGTDHARLRKDWPELGSALDELARAEREREEVARSAAERAGTATWSGHPADRDVEPLARFAVDSGDSPVHVELDADLQVTLQVRYGRQPHELVRVVLEDGATLQSAVTRVMTARAVVVGSDGTLADTREKLSLMGLTGSADDRD